MQNSRIYLFYIFRSALIAIVVVINMQRLNSSIFYVRRCGGFNCSLITIATMKIYCNIQLVIIPLLSSGLVSLFFSRLMTPPKKELVTAQRAFKAACEKIIANVSLSHSYIYLLMSPLPHITVRTIFER